LVEPARLAKQIQFLLEIDKLKKVHRRNYLIDAGRLENSAEHSWHLAILVMVLSEHANERLDAFKVMRMLLIHDIVEIDAGDTYFYADQGDKAVRERAAAERIFGLLPVDQCLEFPQLWEEFESGSTSESRFARALDRFIPQLHNFYSRGRSWEEHGVTAELVLSRNIPISDGSTALWETETLIRTAVEMGFIREK
jgi:putative hydrolases of HD superfamily